MTSTISKQQFPSGTVLVIGGSGGVGASICEAFAAAGSDIVFSYHRNKKRADELRQELGQYDVKVEAIALSLNDPELIQSQIESVSLKQRIHTVVIAAGSDIEQKMIRDISPKEWRSVIDADVNGFFNVIHTALPIMKASGGGSFIHISSAGLHRWPELDALSVAPKACNEWLLKGIAKEEGQFGIRANSIAIGVINAGIFKRLWDDGTFDEAWQDKVQSGLCLKRWGEPEEVASAAVFLASNQAAYITGQLLSVDGGYGV